MFDEVGADLSKAGKVAVKFAKNRHFQIGVLAALPTSISAFFLIRKYKKQIKEKEELYKQVLKKHNVIIKELDSQIKINKERQERLLTYDLCIKKEMCSLKAEIKELKNQLAELNEEKDNYE